MYRSHAQFGDLVSSTTTPSRFCERLQPESGVPRRNFFSTASLLQSAKHFRLCFFDCVPSDTFRLCAYSFFYFPVMFCQICSVNALFTFHFCSIYIPSTIWLCSFRCIPAMFHGSVYFCRMRFVRYVPSDTFHWFHSVFKLMKTT